MTTVRSHSRDREHGGQQVSQNYTPGRSNQAGLDCNRDEERDTGSGNETTEDGNNLDDRLLVAPPGLARFTRCLRQLRRWGRAGWGRLRQGRRLRRLRIPPPLVGRGEAEHGLRSCVALWQGSRLIPPVRLCWRWLPIMLRYPLGRSMGRRLRCPLRRRFRYRFRCRRKLRSRSLRRARCSRRLPACLRKAHLPSSGEPSQPKRAGLQICQSMGKL